MNTVWVQRNHKYIPERNKVLHLYQNFVQDVTKCEYNELLLTKQRR